MKKMKMNLDSRVCDLFDCTYTDRRGDKCSFADYFPFDKTLRDWLNFHFYLNINNTFKADYYEKGTIKEGQMNETSKVVIEIYKELLTNHLDEFSKTFNGINCGIDSGYESKYKGYEITDNEVKILTDCISYD